MTFPRFALSESFPRMACMICFIGVHLSKVKNHIHFFSDRVHGTPQILMQGSECHPQQEMPALNGAFLWLARAVLGSEEQSEVSPLGAPVQTWASFLGSCASLLGMCPSFFLQFLFFRDLLLGSGLFVFFCPSPPYRSTNGCCTEHHYGTFF